jgi:hypothetical protein
MIAIYYVESSSPFHLMAVEVEDDDFSKLIDKLAKEGLPFAENDEYLFIENEKAINQVNLGSGEQKTSF